MTVRKAGLKVGTTEGIVIPAMKKSTTPRTCTIGIDLGGTKVAAALVDANGRILKETRRPTVPDWMAEQDPRKGKHILSPSVIKKHIAYVISAMGDAAAECLEGQKVDLKGVGLASAGPMNIDDGTLDYPSNFKGWKIVPLVQLLQEQLKKRNITCPVAFQNDAIAAALSEGWIGRAQGCSTYAMITVGTGIGSGVIFNGKPAQSHGMGSEWGHVIVDALGISKDFENYYERSVEGLASGTGLIRRARARGFAGSSTRELAAAAAAGDKLALELFENSSEALASLFYSLSLGFHPEKIVVSGGMLPIRQHFLPKAITLYKELIKRKNPKFLAPVQIAKLGTEAGVIGAAYLPHMAHA